MWISFKRWTIMRFSNPQQFHLATTKESWQEEPESPVSSLTSPGLVKLVAVCEDLVFPFSDECLSVSCYWIYLMSCEI